MASRRHAHPQDLLWKAADMASLQGMAKAIALDAGFCVSARLAYDGEPKALALVLAHGADPRWAQDDGTGLCQIALEACSAKNREAALECLRILTAAGADPWHANSHGIGSMSTAIHLDDVDAASFLLAHPSAPHPRIRKDGSPAPQFLARHAVASSRRDCPTILSMLLGAGADPNSRLPRGQARRDLDGQTCLQMAIQCNRPANVEILLAHGANPMRKIEFRAHHLDRPVKLDALALTRKIPGREECAQAIATHIERSILARAAAPALLNSSPLRV